MPHMRFASLLAAALLLLPCRGVLAIEPLHPAVTAVAATVPPENNNTSEEGFKDPFESGDQSTQKQTIKFSDPLEPLNRGVFLFNDRLYFWLLKPAATGFKFITPLPVREHIALFFLNAKFPIRFVNTLMQGRLKSTGIESARFLINTTVGLGGFFDPASNWKLELQKADFDQTLGFYNLPTGPYIVWPILGPSSVRGTFGMAGDTALSPLTYATYIDGADWLMTLRPTELLNSTSLRLGEYEAFKKATLDPYVGMRSSYFEYWQYRDKARP